MTNPIFSFGTGQFNRIFPFYVLIDDKCEIVSYGRSIPKLHPVPEHARFSDLFVLRHPKIAYKDFDGLKTLTGQFVVLSFTDSDANSLHGQIEFLEGTNQVLFIGTPSVHSTDEIKAKSLTISDFASHDPLIDRLIATEADTEQQKQLEHQLKINEKRYRDLFNYSQAFIFTHDMNGKLLSANPAICEKLGYPAEHLTGRMITEFIPKADLALFHSAYMETVKEKGSAKGIFRINDKNDKKSFLLYQNFKVEEEDAEPYIIGFSQDITERIAAERELRKTKKNIEDSAKAKEFFLANMSHEIRTPLTGLLGITNLLSKTHLNDQQRKYTSLITSSANTLLSIVNDILDIEKIASGKFELEHVPFKLEEKVYNTVQSFQFKAEEKNITLSFKSNVAEDLIVIGDPSRLGQILNNLLSNALKFTNSGGIYISVFYHTNGPESTTLEFEVADTGIGIKPERLEDIFNPFVQASTDTSRKFGGTGLGLSICKELVEMHGGTISVNSVLNSGTTFTFYIPYKKGDGTMLVHEKANLALDQRALKDIKVLVAEDWELNRFLVQYILESWGSKVTMANNGKEALDALVKSDFDVILMDIHMPEMDGITATKKIRAHKDKTIASIPIIALTANALKKDHLHYLKAGMNDCITKPYTEEKLYHVITKLVRPAVSEEPEQTETSQETDANFIEQSNLLYDLSFLNKFAKGDTSFIKKMISVFMESMTSELRNLEAAETGENFGQTAKIAHKMKSAIDGLGIDSLKQVVRDLEAYTPEMNDPSVPKMFIEKIRTTLKEVFVQLEAFLKL